MVVCSMSLSGLSEFSNVIPVQVYLTPKVVPSTASSSSLASADSDFSPSSDFFYGSSIIVSSVQSGPGALSKGPFG